MDENKNVNMEENEKRNDDADATQRPTLTGAAGGSTGAGVAINIQKPDSGHDREAQEIDEMKRARQ